MVRLAELSWARTGRRHFRQLLKLFNFAFFQLELEILSDVVSGGVRYSRLG